MKILVFMFEGPISNNIEKIDIEFWDAPGKTYFFEFLWLIWKYWYLCLMVLSIIIKKIKKNYLLPLIRP